MHKIHINDTMMKKMKKFGTTLCMDFI